MRVPNAQDEQNVYTLENVPLFRDTLMNTSLSLFDRYRAMFALRNTVQQGGKDAETPAVLALADGLRDESALFRYVAHANPQPRDLLCIWRAVPPRLGAGHDSGAE